MSMMDMSLINAETRLDGMGQFTFNKAMNE